MTTTNKSEVLELSKAKIQERIAALETSKARTVQKFDDLIQREHRALEAAGLALADAEPPPTRPLVLPARDGVQLPSPSTPPDAPSLEEAPALKRYEPTPEILALTEPADVLTALGKLETPREEHELLSAWTVAGNRAALNAVAVHVGGPLGERAARSLKRLGPSEPTDTNANPGEA